MAFEINMFYECVNKEEEMLLATCAQRRVTMRTVSPVLYNNAVLIFTSPDSTKYKQLKENQNCTFKLGSFFIEAEAEFKGPTMLDTNLELRKAYEAKFSDAFDPTVPFGGINSDFILLKPRSISGWLVISEGHAEPFIYECE